MDNDLIQRTENIVLCVDKNDENKFILFNQRLVLYCIVLVVLFVVVAIAIYGRFMTYSMYM
jgi:hypothetical protein